MVDTLAEAAMTDAAKVAVDNVMRCCCSIEALLAGRPGGTIDGGGGSVVGLKFPTISPITLVESTSQQSIFRMGDLAPLCGMA